MNAFAAVLLVLIALPAAFAEVPSRPAWKWTPEERIAKRLDPDAVQDRANANERDLADFRASVGVPPVPVRFVIEGRKDPALLMPFELFGSILEGLEDQPGTGARRVYRRSIIDSGWDEDTFWRILRDATAEMMKTQRERLAIKDAATYALNVKDVACARTRYRSFANSSAPKHSTASCTRRLPRMSGSAPIFLRPTRRGGCAGLKKAADETQHVPRGFAFILASSVKCVTGHAPTTTYSANAVETGIGSPSS